MAVTVVGAALVNLGVNTSAWFKGLNEASQRWTRFGAGLQVAGFRMMTTITAAIAAIGGAVIKFGKDFETAFAQVQKTFELAGPNAAKAFEIIEKGIRQMATVTPFAVEELSNIARIGAQLGVAPQNILKFTDTIAKLSVAVKELDPEIAARKLVRLINVTGGSMDDIDKLGSVLARLGDNFATTEEAILNFAERAAGLARISGMTAQDLMGISTAFTSVRAQTESGATAMSKALGIIAEAVGSDAGKLEQLAATAEYSAEKFKEAWGKDAAATFVKIIEGVAGAGTRGVEVLKAIGLNNERAKQTFLALAGATGTAKEGLRMAREEFERNLKLQEEYARMAGTLDSMMKVLWNNVKEIGIKAYQAFEERIKSLVVAMLIGILVIGDLVDVFLNLDKATQDSVIEFAAMAAILGPVLIGLGAILSVAVAFASVLVPVALMIGGLVVAFRAFWGESLDLADVLIIVGEVFIELFTVGEKLKQTWIALKMAVYGLALAFIEAMKYNPATMLVAATLEATGAVDALKQKVLDAGKEMAESFVREDEIIKKFSGLREKITNMAGALKGGIGFEGTLEEFLGGREGYKKFEDMLAALELDLDDLGNAGEVAGNNIADGLGKTAKTAAEQMREELEKLVDTLGFLSDFDFSDMTLGGMEKLKSFMEVSPEAIHKNAADLMEGFQAALVMQSGNIQAGSPLAEAIRSQFGAAMKDLEASGMGAMSTMMQNMLGQAGIAVPDEFFVGPKLPDTIEEAKEKTDDWGSSVEKLADTFRILGISSDSVLGRMMGGLKGMHDVFSTIKGAGGLGNMFSTKEGGGLAGGFMDKLGGISNIAGTFGQLFASGMQIGKAIYSLFKKEARWETIAKEGAKTFGTAFSEELAKQIEATEKGGASFGEALAQNIGNIVEEVGVSVENFEAIWGHLFLALDTGFLNTAAGVEQLDKAFGPVVEHLKTMGVEGSLQIGELTRRLLEAGVASEELNAHITEQAGVLRDALTPALEYIGELTDMNAEKAMNYSGVIVAAWGAAVAETGSFIEAVGLLGEEFGTALQNIMENIGPEGEALVGPIAQLYNIISNNQGAFDALHGIVEGMDAMAQMGVLTAESLGSMGQAVKQTFDDIIAKTGDYNATLKASWPELVKMAQYYEKMGLEMPAWLQEAINKGQELGLSMDIPTTVLDALTEMVGLLKAIAEEMGAVAKQTESAARAARGVPGSTPASPGGRGDFGAQSGFLGTITRPTQITVGEIGDESVAITPAGGGGGGGPVSVTLELDGQTLGRIITNMSKDGRVRINPTSISEF